MKHFRTLFPHHTSHEIGAIVDRTRQAVEAWTQVPDKFVLLLERETKTPRYVIRPDLYPLEDYATGFLDKGEK